MAYNSKFTGAQIDALLDASGKMQTSKEDVANKVTSINADADDTHYPSAKAVKDSIAVEETRAKEAEEILNGTKANKTYSDQLVNPKDIKNGYLNAAGQVAGSAYWFVSGYITVAEKIKTTATSLNNVSICVYDKDKKWIRNIASNLYEYQDGDAFIRFHNSNNRLSAAVGEYLPLRDYTENYNEEILKEQLLYANSIDITESVSIITNNIIIADNSRSDFGQTMNWDGNSVTDYILLNDGVKFIQTIVLSSTNITNNIYGLVWYDENKSPLIGVRKPYLYKDGNLVIWLDVPEGAKYVRTTFSAGADASTFFIRTVGDIEHIKDLIDSYQHRINSLEETNAVLENKIEEIEESIEKSDNKTVLFVDLMKCVKNYKSPLNLNVYNVSSATPDSLTINNAEDINLNMILAAKYNDGTYKAIQFNAHEGDKIKVDYDIEDDTLSVNNVVSLMSLHDTKQGDNGQHLSPYGYRAMAHFVADELIKQETLIEKNYKAGLIFSNCSDSVWNDPAIKDAEGNVIMTPIYNGWKRGGNTSNGHGNANSGDVASNSAFGDIKNAFLIKHVYKALQGDVGASVEFPFNLDSTTNGFLEITAGGNIDSSKFIIGTTLMEVIADNKVVHSVVLKPSVQKYIIPNLKCKDISVRFTIQEQQDTNFVIYSMCFYKIFPNTKPSQVLQGKKIAVLGDSWTQFPTTTVAEQYFPGDSDNTVVVRPDGTNGNGCGYFPKELARCSGAIVDNWGSSGTRADNWGLVMIDDILNHSSYDYVIIEFFINDKIAGISNDDWKRNLYTICEKCKNKGARPVIIMPCFTASSGQGYSLAEWHESLLKGFLDINE